MKTYSCPTCGRKGYCPECCCIHRAHEGRMRFAVCPLCKHRVPHVVSQDNDGWGR